VLCLSTNSHLDYQYAEMIAHLVSSTVVTQLIYLQIAVGKCDKS
jgi:hypothetical protein